MLRRRGRLDDALRSLVDLLHKKAPAHWETCRAWFELGHVHDARGDHDAAWQAWTQARCHYPPNARWSLYRQQAVHVWQHVRSLHQAVTGAHLDAWTRAEDSSPSPPLAILTGHPRSGTTLLEQALDAHSGIVSAEETTVFTSAVYRPIFQHAPPGLDPARCLDALTADERRGWSGEYHGLTRLALGEPAGDRLIVDKNPDLLQLLPAVLRIFPAARIIVLRRDPRDVLVSMFAQALPPNHTSYSYRDVRAAGRMIALRLSLWRRLRELMPTARFHEVRYEAAAAHFAREVRGVLNFLGCAPEDGTFDPAAHARRKIVHSPTFAAVQEPVHTRAIGRWKNYERWIAPALEDLQPELDALGCGPT